MIGSGIFNSPKDLIRVANPQGTLVAWVTGGLGALMLALVFVYLATRKPRLKSGIYAYARMDSVIIWIQLSLGLLVCRLVGECELSGTLFQDAERPVRRTCTFTLHRFSIGSALLWLFYAILMAGIREGAILNFIVTTAKLIPILLIIFLGISLVKNDLFLTTDCKAGWHPQRTHLPLLQVKEAMAVILWCFVGVEAASVLSARAKSQQGVRLSIILSLLIVLAVYMLITFIAMSSVPARELADSQTPLALILERTVIGVAGGTIIKLGIMVSVLGASLSWILLSVETLYAAAKDGVLPQTFRR